jgi:hypothetical protein
MVKAPPISVGERDLITIAVFDPGWKLAQLPALWSTIVLSARRFAPLLTEQDEHWKLYLEYSSSFLLWPQIAHSLKRRAFRKPFDGLPTTISVAPALEGKGGVSAY